MSEQTSGAHSGAHSGPHSGHPADGPPHHVVTVDPIEQVDRGPAMRRARWVVIAVGVMMFAARPIGDFVDRHPSVKMLALSFLILVGFTLMLESFDVHVPKGYIYFAMFFSIAVESLNLLRNKKNPL